MDKVTLVLDANQLTVINEGLQLVAFGKVAPLIQDINQQIAAQTQPAPSTVVSAPPQEPTT